LGKLYYWLIFRSFKLQKKMGNSIGASGFGSSSTAEEVAKGILQKN
jgi:hypothetical protein